MLGQVEKKGLRCNMKYIIEYHFTYGWDILNEFCPTYYDTAEKAQAEIDDLIE